MLEFWGIKMSNIKRIEYIDIAKGAAVFLMVLGHSYSYASNSEGEYIVRWLYSFHMPLFFISSGVLYGLRDRCGEGMRLGVKSKCKTLILPYLIWNTTYQCFLSGLAIIGGKPVREALLHYLPMVLRVTGSAMWFLPVMFLSLILFIPITYMRKAGGGLAFVCMLAGTMLPEAGVFFPILLRACVGTGFIAMGFYFAEIFNKKRAWIIVGIQAIVHLAVSLAHDTVSLAGRNFGNPVLYVVASCLGTLWIYDVAKLGKENNALKKLLGYWGRNSIKILCLHEFVLQVLRIVDYKWFGECLPKMGVMEGPVLSGVIILILTIAMPLVNYVLNWTFGFGMKKVR